MRTYELVDGSVDLPTRSTILKSAIRQAVDDASAAAQQLRVERERRTPTLQQTSLEESPKLLETLVSPAPLNYVFSHPQQVEASAQTLVKDLRARKRCQDKFRWRYFFS
ncbi:hypothetical protein GN244_ATG18729 [Phytophthora infestans]|uniref:Uncharacterized protein n=1 Tax=Phytophthora infestans TaxID=4787 RepID=A0A833S6C6_PHYIN|nr:hypothetical protein GN244_ATG18729 [Phytophthora infestans]